MSTFNLSAFFPARPSTSVDIAEKLRKQWPDLMDQLFVHAKKVPDDGELEEEKQHWATRWESLTTRVMDAKDTAKSRQLNIQFTFPEDVYAAVEESQQKFDRWKLESAAVARAQSGRPKSMAHVTAADGPPTPSSEPSASRSNRPNARPVVEIQVKNASVNCSGSGLRLHQNSLRMPLMNHDVQENDPPCERCKGKAKCIVRPQLNSCDLCRTKKKKCSLSTYQRGAAAKVSDPSQSTLFSTTAKEDEVVEVTSDSTRVAKRKRGALEEEPKEGEIVELTTDSVRVAKRKRNLEEEPKQDDEALKRRIREIEAELLQLSNSAHDISNKAYSLAVEIREMGESLGTNDRK